MGCSIIASLSDAEPIRLRLGQHMRVRHRPAPSGSRQSHTREVNRLIRGNFTAEPTFLNRARQSHVFNEAGQLGWYRQIRFSSKCGKNLLRRLGRKLYLPAFLLCESSIIASENNVTVPTRFTINLANVPELLSSMTT